MTPEEFVADVNSTVVEQNIAIYKDLFSSTTVETARDPYWRQALAFYASLKEEDRKILFAIMRQVTVDAVSNVLGVLDGSSPLSKVHEDLVLTGKGDNRKLNGNLQDIFLEVESKS